MDYMHLVQWVADRLQKAGFTEVEVKITCYGNEKFPVATIEYTDGSKKQKLQYCASKEMSIEDMLRSFVQQLGR